MIAVLKIILVLIFSCILIQDIKERQVYWFLFPMVGIVSGVLFYKSTLPQLFFSSISINVFVIIFLLATVYLYAKLKLKTTMNSVFGIGDALLFLALSLTFSSVSFIVVFVFALLFSLLLHIFLSKQSSKKTVPLAGYMSLFFMLIYISQWSGLTKNLYTL